MHSSDTSRQALPESNSCYGVISLERLGTHPHDGTSRDLELAPENKVMLLCDSDLPNAHRGVHAQHLLQQQPELQALILAWKGSMEATACDWQDAWRVSAGSRSAHGVIFMQLRCFSYGACQL